MATKKTNMVAAGAAAGAAAIAAAGAYWFYGAEGAAKNRKMVRSTLLKARAEVAEAVEKLQDIDKSQYLAIVEGVVKRYSTAAGVTEAEVGQMTRDLKAAWQHMHAARMRLLAPKGKAPTKKVAPKKAKARTGQK